MTAKKSLNYQKARLELDQIIGKLQDGEADIDEAVKLYQRGSEIIKELQAYLKHAENTVKKVQSAKH